MKIESLSVTAKSSLLLIHNLIEFAESKELFNSYLNLRWGQDRYNFSGREVLSPRLIYLMGDKDYFYSGIAHKTNPWDKVTLELKAKANAAFVEYPLDHNGVLFNQYRNGRDSVSMHSDNERAVDTTTPIMSINLGGSRIFNILVNASNKQYNLLLENGSALLMLGEFQNECKHGIAKDNTRNETRINLTFRKFI